MTRINKYVLLSFITSLIMGLIIAPLRGGYVSIGSITGFSLSSIIGFIAFYFQTLFFLHKKDSIWTPISIAIGLSFFTLPIHILSFESTLISLLEWFIHLIGVVAGYACYKLNRRSVKYIFSVLLVSGAYVLSTTGYESWLFYLNYHTFTGEIPEKQISSDLCVQNAKGESVDWDDFQKEIIVLDFWFKGCGSCYEALPDVQKLHNAYLGTDIGVYTVYVGSEHRRENYLTGDSILKRKGYNLPALFMRDDSPILKELNVTNYPMVIVINRKQQLIFRGNIEKAKQFIKQERLAETGMR